MTLFKSRASPNSSVSSQLGNSQTIFSPLHSPSSPLSTAGLITKVHFSKSAAANDRIGVKWLSFYFVQVREKAVLRSTDSPLLQPFSVGTPDTSVSESDGSFHIGHKASALRKSTTSIGSDFTDFIFVNKITLILIEAEVILEVGQLVASWIPKTDRFNRWIVMVRYHLLFDCRFGSVLSFIKILKYLFC